MKKALFTLLCAATLIIWFGSCGKDHTIIHTPGKTYVIVPGSWSGPYAWQAVKARLESEGQVVKVVQLPGHGSDQTTPYATITLDQYRDKVIGVIDSLNTKVILIGHSMAGMVISAVAEKIPSKIEKMIYVGAFLPKSGQSLLELALTDNTSLLGMSLRPTSATLDSLDVVRDNIPDIFVQDGSADIKAFLIKNYKLEPGQPFKAPVVLTDANWGSVDKYFIHTLQDHAVTYILQKREVAAAGLTKTYTINSSHSPFLSRPDSLTILFRQIAGN
ncbi:alpha/beta fold hydrolase [Mucilaginibacter aquaedulcis]|uniref:alpha/beta fold hydrolase n=1 Tax=Mucilaginibacter aquaedulcis TaxID=1187081 RepID=UPI0025B5B29C|nr:alpha/beta fold hydrolase [Mucilaginibacter aquaedulcis]MDN3548882.1 alpha/beta fold hydrolase [Mucilaginibacter aquaedulcis]